jgi:hypothetical protein
MKTMSRGKLSRFGTLIGAAVVVTLASAVVARAAGFFASIFISAPFDFSFSYSLGAGASTGCVTPVAGIPNQIVGVDTTLGTRGVGEVGLLRIASSFLEWTGVESPLGAAITSGFSSSLGAHIVFIDFSHTTQIEVCSADSFRVHNKSSFTHTGVVDLWY